MRKHVAFDTSFLINVQNGKFDIDRMFPFSIYKRWVTLTVAQEFICDHNKNIRDEETLKQDGFFRKFNLHEFNEFKIYSMEYFSENAVINYMRESSTLQDELDNDFLRKIPQIKDKLMKHKEKSNVLIKTLSGQNTSLPIKYERIESIITTNIHRNEVVRLLKIFLENWISIILNNNVNFQYSKMASAIKKICKGKIVDRVIYSASFISKRFFDEWTNSKSKDSVYQNYPSFYNKIVFLIFLCLLQINQQKENTKNKITVETIPKPETRFGHPHNKTDGPIKIDKNFREDENIFSGTLHYIDFFVTCDKNLAKLLLFLYPNYKKKIHYYCPEDQCGFCSACQP